MSTANQSVWIGLLEICPRENSKILQGVSGAYVNVLTWAEDADQFREKAALVMNSLNLEILSVQDAEPFENRGIVEDKEIQEIEERVRANPNAIIYSKFHSWNEIPS